jgi:hypothetical protein
MLPSPTSQDRARIVFDWLRKVFRRSHDAVIRVYDAAGNVIETHEHNGDFKEW